MLTCQLVESRRLLVGKRKYLAAGEDTLNWFDFDGHQSVTIPVQFLFAAGLNPSRVLKAPGCDLGHRKPVVGVKQFRELGEANFLGPVSINRAVTRLMSEGGFGPTVHIGSIAPM